jgi:hypothetical protein
MPINKIANNDTPDRVRNIRTLNQTEQQFIKTTLKAVSIDEKIVAGEDKLRILDSQNEQFSNGTRSVSRYYLLFIVIFASFIIDYVFLSPAIDFILSTSGMKRTEQKN